MIRRSKKKLSLGAELLSKLQISGKLLNELIEGVEDLLILENDFSQLRIKEMFLFKREKCLLHQNVNFCSCMSFPGGKHSQGYAAVGHFMEEILEENTQ